MRAIPLVTALAVGTATITISAPASAATVRYASPTGSGSACTQAAPCSLSTAVTAAPNGATVQLTADEYFLYSPLDVGVDDLTIAGPAGVNTPADFKAYIIFPEAVDGGVADTTTKLRIFGDNVRLERLAITGRADGSASLITNGVGSTGTRYDRVWLRNSGTSDTVRGQNVTMTNSVVTQDGGADGAAVTFSGTIIGSTVYARLGTAILQSRGYHQDPDCGIIIRNTIAIGDRANLKIDNTAGSCPSVTADYDYSWIPRTGTGGGIDGTPTEGAHNLPDLPSVFGGPIEISDLTLPATSPAIDAGCTGGVCSDHDYYGRPRPIGSRNDIGAMEQALPPALTAPTAAGVTTTSATISTGISPQGATTAYTLQYRLAGTSGWTEAAAGAVATNLFGQSTAGATLVGLEPGRDYETRTTGSNDRGTTTSAVGTFRTASLPVTPTVTLSGLRAKVTKRKATLRSTATTSAAGILSQRATAAGKPVCRSAARTVAPGATSLTCTWSKKARNHLRRKKLAVTVVTTLQPPGTPAVSTTSQLRVKRKR